MIYIYNETNTPWTSESISPKLNRFLVTKETKDGRTRKMSMPSATDIKVEGLDKYVNMNDVATIYNGTSGIYYQKRDQSAVISGYSKYDKDIFFISLNLEGSIITNVAPKGVQVINYQITKNQLDLVLASSPTNRANNIEITLYNKRENVEKTYSFIYNEHAGCYEVRTSEGECVVSKVAEQGEVNVQSFKFTKFRPAIITKCIITNSKDMDALKSIIRNPDIFYINSFTDNNDLEALITRLKDEKYSAVTLFMNIADPRDIAGDTYASIKNVFPIVNILLNTDKVVRR